ncbi:MAG: hypothetical protein WC714_28495 [Candidatus Obscuribacterales bacterium]|jgi:hypothetical protein
MNSNDFSTFHSSWINAHAMSVSNQVPSDAVVMAVFDILSEYPLNQVLYSIQQHAKGSKFPPTPADVIEVISDRNGSKHIGAEEAWAIALESFDEYSTVVWTQPIAEARGAAYGLFLDGDKVAARMAFKDAYTRIIKTADEPRWIVNEGFDKARRADSVKQAVFLKRLPKEIESRYMLEAPTTTTQKLIEQAHEKTGKVDALAKLGMIKSILAIEEDDGVARRERERLEFEAHRKAQLDKIENKLRGELH